ncbi:4Fe-4S ferredoxin, iron-sulfur binding (plasmid) [Nitrobacter hamburgensis X14]|uniref:4Fe-4S ferredoxin, iron-sulfur binding n=1 Tax=Nitrobacter hamburgensis (strain DSM 10229 / NCIMB 13809 / X14) TaxID=323097 RepID=Q1QG37_NITHX|nr:4Fe-4S dicluster domain-containing protein [Nitrobacter hamburgensis]ABE64810.1 4Fe-4S ferredoxin, iron-sulfur binding [Nitrobacter hamburgensis X14]
MKPDLSGVKSDDVLRFSRRDALRIFAAHMALAVAGCSKPVEEIVPYVNMPEGLVPSEPLRFATAVPMGGYGLGIMGISVDGRPIKVEGNPRHFASLGATDVFAEAAVLSLYDPDRSRTPTQKGSIASWDAFRAALLPQLGKHDRNRGNGLRLLTGRVTSPTLLRQIDGLLARYPQAMWHVHEPIDDSLERQGTVLAFGRALHVLPRLYKAEVMLCLDADPLGSGPSQIANARHWIEARNPKTPSGFARSYVVESGPTLTGTKADHRLALHPAGISDIAIAVANTLGAGMAQPKLSPAAERFAKAAAGDLIAHKGHALVLAGRTQRADIHALAHWINARLDAPLDFIAPFDRSSAHEPSAFAALADDLQAGRVETLVIVDTNIGYDAPADMSIATALDKVSFSAHLGLYADETAGLCHWHLPQSHPFESWSDLRAIDGTAAIVQPLIRPLYATRSAHDFLTMLTGQDAVSSYDLVRETWRSSGAASFEDWWRQTLHDGVVPASAAQPVTAGTPKRPEITSTEAQGELTLVLSPDSSAWDGRFANNPWLQECPKPVSKEVWGNALWISTADAERRNLKTGDVVRLSVKDRAVETPVLVTGGCPPGVVNLTLGYGRRNAGAIGSSIGANAYRLRTSDALWTIEGVTIAATAERREILTTQNHVRLEGDARDLYPIRSLKDIAEATGPDATDRPLPTLYPPVASDTYAWGMVIDTAACIGCNACVVACQAENNVPVVGPEEIARGRDMHWLRIDIYDHGTSDMPETGFQPVPCMQCENAPCEPVCPVAASVHDSEGLNAQVYNRCVGTRFCEANCPYKVRRFNFFGYADGQEYANLGAETIKAQRNPDVSTRQRGVMEKCTYCVQRISRARREAKKEDRTIADGEVVTACQSACPTQAITFGDLNDRSSAVKGLKNDPRNYALLGHLDTRPRTTYLADLRNPNGALKGERS